MVLELVLETRLNPEHSFRGIGFFFWSDILSFASAKFGISSSLQLLQFDIRVQFLQLFWYFVFPSISAIWYLRSVSANLFCALA
jgi:hypothetical protein